MKSAIAEPLSYSAHLAPADMILIRTAEHRDRLAPQRSPMSPSFFPRS
ncbi:hypothetical protein I545_4974 [Mycobacterium kansasii 662]|uniref:Uncharacterized protein n=2 Tax=Mycobacterium kansasii TaxID=1768 RepID=A0A1V3XAP5_MYCKA|nr:hypothetical protein I545_4974 [Mycobacterium kansasii 662]OOK76313.1 hypothetical protein BZL30_3996 [Mycobacterium kansasii]